MSVYRAKTQFLITGSKDRVTERGKLKFVIAGGSGLIGTALVRHLQAAGHCIEILSRSANLKSDNHILWNPEKDLLPPEVFNGSDVVIHLGGESILGRWTPAKKRQIEESRVRSTSLIATTLSSLANPPHTFLCASAIGAYGNSESVVFTERSDFGSGFLPEVSKRWEGACQPCRDAGIRVVNLRFGIVLSRNGGALAQMLPSFRFGFGGRIGKGTQMMSWISIDDTVGAIDFLIHNQTIAGPVNIVAPEPVNNSKFSNTLAAVLSRPCLFSVPEFAIRALFGEMGQTLLLEGQTVTPEVLIQNGYQFRFPELKAALEYLLRQK